jgi:hypothetical protein
MYYGLKSLLIRRTLALEKCNGAFYAPLSQLLSLGGLLRRGEVNSYELVIVPRYQPGQETVLTPISRSLALKELIEQSLDLQLRGAEGLEMLVELVREADCYSLSTSSLKETAELVKGLTL